MLPSPKQMVGTAVCTRRCIIGLIGLACATWPGVASALTFGFGVFNPSGFDQTFTFSVPGVLSAAGPVNVHLAYGMAIGDGSRNGAAMGTAVGAPGIAQAILSQGAMSSTAAVAGTSQSFTGEGGTPGAFAMSSRAVTGFLPSSFTQNSFFALSGETLVQTTLARAFADLGAEDGGSVTRHLLPGIMQTRIGDPGNELLVLDLGVDAVFPPDVGALPPENASGIANCNRASVCDGFVPAVDELSFAVSNPDFAAILTRTEVGGSPLTGPVAWTLTASDDAVFDCGAAGCDAMRVDISFTLSPFNAVALVGRLEVEPVPAAVPEPGMLALLGLAWAGFCTYRVRHPRA
jgi:hypothetical protein